MAAVALAMLWRPGLALMVTATSPPEGRRTEKELSRW